MTGEENPHPVSVRRTVTSQLSSQVFSLQVELATVRRCQNLLRRMVMDRVTSVEDDELFLKAAFAHDHNEEESTTVKPCQSQQTSTTNRTSDEAVDGSDNAWRLVSAIHFRLSKKRIVDATLAKLLEIERFLVSVLNEENHEVEVQSVRQAVCGNVW